MCSLHSVSTKMITKRASWVAILLLFFSSRFCLQPIVAQNDEVQVTNEGEDFDSMEKYLETLQCKISELSARVAELGQAVENRKYEGWMIIQQRVDDSISFDRGWSEYRNGFGNPATNYWIGLELLYQLTSKSQYELFIEVKFANGTIGNGVYSDFRVGSENEKYKLIKIGDWSGTIYDALRTHVGFSFSTYDSWNGPYNGQYNGKKWTQVDQGGWWYYSSYVSQLNSGFYSTWGIYWNNSKLKYAKMMIRKK